jgi:hypothetical protein
MKKKKAEKPTDFEVEDADAAFRKFESAARRLFSSAKPKAPAKRTSGKKK